MLDLWVLVVLGFVGVAAGFIDAVAGGGGMIALPALLSFGVPPVAALATNKMQSVVGTSMATLTYWRKGFIDLKILAPAVVATFAGSFIGASVVKNLDTSVLAKFVPFALIGIAIYFLVAPKLSDENKKPRLNIIYFLPVLGFCVGFYDGIFGPGTGSFFAIGFVTLFGFGMTRATGHTKALNMTSNLAALALFIPAGDVLWPVALVMAAGQIVGAYLGALSGIKMGAKLIKPLVVIVSIAMALRLLFVS